MLRKDKPVEQRVVLPDVSWQQFEQLLAELGNSRTTRLTYWRSKLEMMTPLPEHERCRKLIDSLILSLVGELGWSIAAIAPVLLTAPELRCGTEPDACYYLTTPAPPQVPTEPDVFDAAGMPIALMFPPDPPPDLLVEVAMTKSSLNKLTIYANLGIPEVWRYITQPGDEVLKGELLIYQLQDHEYVEAPNSKIFPFLPAQRVREFLEQSEVLGLAKALIVLRDWIRGHQ